MLSLRALRASRARVGSRAPSRDAPSRPPQARHMHAQVWKAYGKSEELPEEKTEALAGLIEKSQSLSLTRPDRRFPNMNQVNACW